jgi:hypothetical protein
MGEKIDEFLKNFNNIDKNNKNENIYKNLNENNENNLKNNKDENTPKNQNENNENYLKNVNNITEINEIKDEKNENEKNEKFLKFLQKYRKKIKKIEKERLKLNLLLKNFLIINQSFILIQNENVYKNNSLINLEISKFFIILIDYKKKSLFWKLFHFKNLFHFISQDNLLILEICIFFFFFIF